ncbi:MAG: extracellular solute-binding protein [Gammaproteobacteria bacterium]
MLAVLAVLLAGCGRTADPRTVVEVWGLGREGEVLAGLVPEFERTHPGLRVRVQQIPWSAAHEKLLTAFVAEALPDVIQIGNTWVAEFATLKAIAPIDDMLEGESALPRGDFVAGALAANAIDGRTWALPWYVDTRLMFYRSDLLAQAGVAAAPRTWDGWSQAFARLRAVHGAQYRPLFLPLGEWEPVVLLALAHGAPLLADGGRRGAFSDPRFGAALAQYLALYRDGAAERAAAQQIGNLYQEFARGGFAVMITGPWNIGELRRRLPPALQPHWATAPLPALEGPGPGPGIAGGASLALTRRGAQSAGARALVAFLLRTDMQVRLNALTGSLPARQSAWRAAGLDRAPHTRAFWDQLAHLEPLPAVAEWEQIADRIGRSAEALARGQADVATATAALDRRVDAILEKRRWMLARVGAP